MVESALEFARIARSLDFHDFIFSMKSSNPKVMIAAYRLLADRLEREGPDWNYPLHLGVTEAGDGEDGRIKSAIGIGSLLQRRHRRHRARFADRRQRARDSRGARAGGSVAPRRRRTGSARPGPLAFDPFSYRRRAAARMAVGDVAVGLGRGAARGGAADDARQDRAQARPAWAISSRRSSTNRRACARSTRATTSGACADQRRGG